MKHTRQLPRVAAECFPPGEFIREDMEALGWSPETLATMLRWPRSPRGSLPGGSA